jgi:L-asparaginase/Glu-tRNA(Gln) amidotransferase subunit D
LELPQGRQTLVNVWGSIGVGSRFLRAVSVGVQVRVASRCAQGRMVMPGDARWRDAGGLSPVKARVALMLELMDG